MIDLLLWFGASPYEIESYMQNNDTDGRLLQAAGAVAFHNESRAGEIKLRSTAFVSMNRCAGADIERVELHGNGCSFEVINLETGIWQRSGPAGSKDTRSFNGWNSIGERRGFAGAVQHFLNTIEHPDRCSIKASAVLETHRLVERLIHWVK